MDPMELFRAVLALVFVLGLIAAAAWIARRYVPSMFSAKPKGNRRLGLIESLQIDTRHRLVLIQRDDKRHLILIGPGQCQLIEGSIIEPGTAS